MDFAWQDHQRMLAETAAKVGEGFGLDYWREKDAKKEFGTEFWQAVCDAGLAGVALPEAHGGAGLGMLELAIVIEALAAAGGGPTIGQIFMTNPIFGGVSISRFGTPGMKRDYLPKLCSGAMCFAMALTEPDAGSNTLALRSFAARNGSGWRLNGRKIWITGVPQCHKILVVARTTRLEESPTRTHGISLFLIDRDRAGVSHTAIEKVGTNTNPSSLVYFENVAIREDELMGTVDQGWPALLEVLNTERIVTTACLVGGGRLALKLGIDYANQRKVFGDRPIGAYQGLQFPLAQAHAEIECARLVNFKAAWLHDTGQPYGSEANVGKLIAAQATMAAIERAMQAMGGMGFAKETHLERLWRDTRLFRFAPVPEEMILNFIAVHDLGLPRGY